MHVTIKIIHESNRRIILNSHLAADCVCPCVIVWLKRFRWTPDKKQVLSTKFAKIQPLFEKLGFHRKAFSFRQNG
jgi:hypothetical protein